MHCYAIVAGLTKLGGGDGGGGGAYGNRSLSRCFSSGCGAARWLPSLRLHRLQLCLTPRFSPHRDTSSGRVEIPHRQNSWISLNLRSTTGIIPHAKTTQRRAALLRRCARPVASGEGTFNIPLQHSGGSAYTTPTHALHIQCCEKHHPRTNIVRSGGIYHTPLGGRERERDKKEKRGWIATEGI